jgi:catechol 2,3-dioxygenase-like lactoylglutathione lyase family enzyme
MTIIGIESLVYGVKDLDKSTKFFEDFGLVRDPETAEGASFALPEGSRIVLLPLGHAALPAKTLVKGAGVQEIVWGVDSQRSLDRLASKVAKAVDITKGDDGLIRFTPPFGVPMALRVFTKRPVLCVPDPLNAPGHVGRLNQHRKWRRRARPKVIAHAVFAVPEFERAYLFMVDQLDFRVSDSQRGFGIYLRADGTNNHHNFLLLNANAPLPEMDGTVKFHHANFGVEDIDEMMIGANHMVRQGWEASHFGLGRHRVDSALFYYLPCPAGGEAEYGADGDYVDDGWVPRDWENPLFGYAHHVHNLPPFLQKEPAWAIKYLSDDSGSGVRP